MDKVSEQIPALATTIAALILVFFVLLFTSWEGYAAAEKNAAKAKLRSRAWATFFAFISSVLAATFCLIGVGSGHQPHWPDWVGLSFLILAVLLMTAVAFKALMEIS